MPANENKPRLKQLVEAVQDATDELEKTHSVAEVADRMEALAERMRQIAGSLPKAREEAD
jgi:hypothetical protein